MIENLNAHIRADGSLPVRAYQVRPDGDRVIVVNIGGGNFSDNIIWSAVRAAMRAKYGDGNVTCWELA